MMAVVAALLMQASVAHPQAAPSFEILSQQAADARDAQRLDQALTLYRQALKLQPAWEDGLWSAGSIEYSQDKYKECAADFGRLAALKPDRAPVRAMAGLCEYHLHDYPAALGSLLEAQRLGSHGQTDLTRTARLHLALVLIKLQSYEKAIAALLEMTRNGQKTPDVVVAAGIAGLRQSWTPPEVPPSQRDKVFKLGQAMTALLEQDSPEALRKFEVAVRDYPEDPNVHFRFGAFLMRQDPERGTREMRKALDLQPDHIPALVSLSAIYRKDGDTQTARKYADRAIQLDPHDFATHIILGRIMLDTDDTTGAVRELETAVKLAPQSPEAHLNLASAYAKLGRNEDAVREREQFGRLRELSEPTQP